MMEKDSVEALKSEVQHLRKENNLLRRIFRDMPDTYYCTDINGVITMVSPSAKDLMGCPTQELIGKHIADYYLHPEDRAVFLEKLAASGGILRDHEHQVRRATGDVIWLSTNAQYVYDDEHNVVGVEGIIRDITKCKLLEKKLLNAEKHQALSGLIGGIAHHFNNDLAAISGLLYLLRSKLEKSKVHQEYLEKIDDKAFHIAEIIKKLLTFSNHSIEHERMEVWGAASLLEKAIERFKNLQNKPLNIQLQIADYEAKIICETEKMMLAFINVLNNAYDASSEPSETLISVKLRMIALPEQEPHLEITIEDDGCGMSEETLARAKEPFFSTKEVGKGNGLGLSVTSGIIHQHGGQFQLKSQIGKGTEACIHLPLYWDDDDKVANA